MKITYKQIRDKVLEPYRMSLRGRDTGIVLKAVNQGIDSHLEACFVSDRGDTYEWLNEALVCKVSAESLPVLLRRILEDNTEEHFDDRMLLVSDILSTLDLQIPDADFPTIVKS